MINIFDINNYEYLINPSDVDYVESCDYGQRRIKLLSGKSIFTKLTIEEIKGKLKDL